MSKTDTVIFDLDGTLLDTLDDLADAMNVTLSKHGLPQRTRDQSRMAVGNGLRMMMKRSLPLGENTPGFEEILEDFRGYYKDHSQIKTKAYDGIKEMMRSLAQRDYSFAIVSNKPDEAVKALAKSYFGEFDIVASGENEKAGIPKKPSPEMVFKALDVLGKSAGNAVYVGDSDVDIITAKNAGMTCISVTWGFRSEEFLRENGAEILARTPSELEVLIKSM